MVDVFFFEAFSEEAAALKRYLPATIDAAFTDLTIQESGYDLPPARLISIRTQSQLPASWAGHLLGVLSRSTGYDHLSAYAAAVRTAPALGYLPLYCHRAVAEQAVMLWLALLRRLPRQIRQFRAFQRDGLTGAECWQKTLVVVGVGHIGLEVCRLGHALGMRVLGVERTPIHPEITYVEAASALAQADIVVCAMDLNPANHRYFDRGRLEQIKPGAIFINISRGELSPASLLLEALTSGHLGGVGLDVYDHEAALAVALRAGTPVEDISDNEARAAVALSQRDDAICTPHNAFNSLEAVERKSEHSVQQIRAFLAGGSFLWTAPRG